MSLGSTLAATSVANASGLLDDEEQKKRAAMAAMSTPRGGLLDGAPVPAGGPDDGNTAWGNLTPLQQAEFYASHPNFAAVTQLGQNLFGYTTPGMIQNAMFPGFVQDQQMIAQGLDPAGGQHSFSQNGSDVGAHPGNGFGGPIGGGNSAPAGGFTGDPMSLTNGLVSAVIGTQAPAPVDTIDIGGLLGGADAGAAAPSMGNDTVGFGSYGEMGGVVGADAGGDGGGGGSKMICTELHRQGLMPEDIFLADQAFGQILVATEPHVYDGYARWARHVVRWMQRGDLAGRVVTKIAHFIATPWSREMAHRMGVPVKRSAAGWLLMEGGLRLCGALGRKATPKLEHA